MRINPALRLAAIPAVLGSLTLSAHTQTISLSVNLRTDNPSGDLNQLVPGDQVWFDLAVAVDPTADPTGQGNGNRGLATLVYDVVGFETTAQGRILSGMADAFSGFDANFGNPQTVASPFFYAGRKLRTDGPTGYGGGWGFDSGGLSGAGDVITDPGAIRSAGIAAPIAWFADVSGNVGLQPIARQGVGHGTYTFPPDDPIVGGLQGGFGQDFSNIHNIIEGDGSWLFQSGFIDTTGWPLGTYNFDVKTIGVNLYDASFDYTADISSGFRVQVDPADIAGTSFWFTLGSQMTCSSACADIDRSGGPVDLQDFAKFVLCFNESPSSSGNCFCSDLNRDGTINLFDFATFSLLFGATSTNTAPNCP